MEDNRTFTSYIARLIAMLITLVLFGLAIWFVVQLMTDNNTVTVTDDEAIVAVVDEETVAKDKGEAVAVIEDSEGVIVAEDDVEGEGYIDSIISEDTTVTIVSPGFIETMTAATEDELIDAVSAVGDTNQTTQPIETDTEGDTANGENTPETVAIATDTELPNTGPGETLLSAVAITAAYLAAKKYFASRKQLATSRI